MHLADHIRPLLRDHDCVIIPDFGGLVADASPARAQPGRQVLSPPSKLVAFNQALTRNDGLLVDALSQHTGLSIAQAREAVRTAVAGLQQELDATNRTELPGIGIFRRAAGRGLAFEYTGQDNLLASAFGLPELAARPVRAHDARTRRPQPALRGAAARRSRWVRLLPAGAIAAALALLLLANYQVALKAGYLPAKWRAALATTQAPTPRTVPAVVATEPQQATLGQHDFGGAAPLEDGIDPEKMATPANWPATETVLAPDSSTLATKEEVEITATPAAPATPTLPKKSVSAVPVVRAVPAAPLRTNTIKARTGRYYVIAGAYRSLANAEQGRKVLARGGHPARIILPPFGSRLFRLTAADYADLASAQQEAQRLRLSTRSDYNTLKF